MINNKLKYQQLADYIIQQIEDGELNLGDQIPSIKQLQQKFLMSKETLLKGLGYLVEKGIIESVYRKGYFVKTMNTQHHYRVFLLLDKMNILREELYKSLIKNLQSKGEIDIFFHHHNYQVFKKLITENIGEYTHYVIATFINEDLRDVLNLIPKKKLIIIDLKEEGLQGNNSCIYQDYGYDIYKGLLKLRAELSKYKRLILVHHPEAVHGKLVISGFLKFCNEMEFPYKIQSNIDEKSFQSGDAYVTFSRFDTDDVTLIKLTRKKNLQLGKDIGLLSYNDSEVKEILEGGITVISTDFKKMGESIATAILEDKIIIRKNPTRVIKRRSL